MAGQAVWCELVAGSRSLIAREDTGNLSGARLLGAAIRPNAASSRGHAGMFPEFGNREIRANEHGFSRRESRSRTGGPGLFRGHSLQCCSTNTVGDGLGVPRMPFGFGALQLLCLSDSLSRSGGNFSRSFDGSSGASKTRRSRSGGGASARTQSLRPRPPTDCDSSVSLADRDR